MGATSSPAPTSKNPFQATSEEDIETYRARMADEKYLERERQKRLPLHKKGKAVLNHPRVALREELAQDDDLDQGPQSLKDLSEQRRRDKLGEALDQLAITTRDRRVEQQQLSDYVSKKRELFLTKYSLDVKREEMQKLEQKAREEEMKVEEAERWLEADATKFDQFLRENDRRAVEAIKLAEEASHHKHELASEIKKLQAEVMAVSADVTKQGDKISELRAFRDFLEELSPEDWSASAGAKRADARRAVVKDIKPEDIAATANATTASPSGSARPKRRLTSVGEPGGTKPSSGRLRSGAASDTAMAGDIDVVEDFVDLKINPELYFTKPTELLHILEELEQSNLSLIQNGQETEEGLQDLKERLALEREALLSERTAVEDQLQRLQSDIDAERQQSRDLEDKCRFFSSASGEEQEQELEQFDHKVGEVYKACIGENEAGISTLQMLTNIENKLEELFEKMQKMPPAQLAEAEKAKDKARRQRLREEKLQAQKKHQEERLKRAQQRAADGPKKRTGKKLMFRSAPPEKPKQQVKRHVQSVEEEERQIYFS